MSLPIPRPTEIALRAPGPARVVARLVLLLLCLLTAGCAASTATHHGREAEHSEDYDRAVAEYTRALRLKPHDNETRLALERAKLRASEEHYQRGRRLAAAGKFDEALV